MNVSDTASNIRPLKASAFCERMNPCVCVRVVALLYVIQNMCNNGETYLPVFKGKSASGVVFIGHAKVRIIFPSHTVIVESLFVIFYKT